MVAQVHDQLLGREGLPGGISRASRLAAATLGAGVAVQELSPGELFDGADAQGIICLFDVVDLGGAPGWSSRRKKMLVGEATMWRSLV
jgi:hypothetical protein